MAYKPVFHAYSAIMDSFFLRDITRPVTSLGQQEGRRVFWEGPKYFELCPVLFKFVQNIFPGGEKIFTRGGFAPPGYGPAHYISQYYHCL